MVVALYAVSKKYEQTIVLESTTLEFKEGTTTVLIGPSGCGKSTLLRLIVRLIIPTTGKIFFNRQEFTEQNANKLRQQIGYVIQEGGLFPHLTAKHNIILVAQLLKYSSKVIEQRLEELCELVQISPSQLSFYPRELSGGQRQRISLMRALMLNPQCILLDEPLGALDPITRHELQIQLKQIFARLNKTVILVTHDIYEAAYFGEELILMRAGKIVQKGSFKKLSEHPKEPFVSEFIQLQQPPLLWSKYEY